MEQIAEQLNLISNQVQLLTKNQETLQRQVREVSDDLSGRTKTSPMEVANPSGGSNPAKREPNYDEMLQIIKDKYLSIPWLKSHRHDIAFILTLRKEYEKGFNFEDSDRAYKDRVKVYYYATQFGWDEAIKRSKADEISRMGLEAHVITAPIATIRDEGRQYYRQRSTSSWKPRSRSRSSSRRK